MADILSMGDKLSMDFSLFCDFDPDIPFLRIVSLLNKSLIKSPPPAAGAFSFSFFRSSFLSFELFSLAAFVPPALRIADIRSDRPPSEVTASDTFFGFAPPSKSNEFVCKTMQFHK